METKIIQNKLLSMLNQFHQVCEENNIKYFILGGTLLGAVRHKGFIPWDDDIDVGIPREDYQKFIELSNKILPENLELKYYKNTVESPFHFVKLVDKNTTLVEREYKDHVEGIYIDVFPLDGDVGIGIGSKIRWQIIRICLSLILNHCYSERKTRIKRFYAAFAKQVNLDRLHEFLEELITRNSYKDSIIVGNYLGRYGKKEFVPKDYFGTPTLYQFEDAKFYGPEKFDNYLTAIYGEYMKLPPKEKQVNSHQYYYVNIDLPYKNFDFKD